MYDTDAFIGGEYNVQNGKPYGFAVIDQAGTGGADIDDPASADFFESHGDASQGMKGTSGDVEYLCSLNPTAVSMTSLSAFGKSSSVWIACVMVLYLLTTLTLVKSNNLKRIRLLTERKVT